MSIKEYVQKVVRETKEAIPSKNGISPAIEMRISLNAEGGVCDKIDDEKALLKITII